MSSHVAECRSFLVNQLEKGVSLKLLDGSIRAGYVYAVDPQVPCALLLIKVRDDVKLNYFALSVVFKGCKGIKSNLGH